MSNYDARQYFKEAILHKDKERAKEVYKAALNNGLDADALFKQTVAEIKTDYTYQIKQQSRDLLSKLRLLGKEKGRQKLDAMLLRGEISPDMVKQLTKILQTEQKVAIQKSRLKKLLQ